MLFSESSLHYIKRKYLIFALLKQNQFYNMSHQWIAISNLPVKHYADNAAYYIAMVPITNIWHVLFLEFIHYKHPQFVL